MMLIDVVASLRSARSLRSVSLAHPAPAALHLQALAVLQAHLIVAQALALLSQALCTTSIRVMNALVLHLVAVLAPQAHPLVHLPAALPAQAPAHLPVTPAHLIMC